MVWQASCECGNFRFDSGCHFGRVGAVGNIIIPYFLPGFRIELVPNEMNCPNYLQARPIESCWALTKSY